MRTVVTLVSIMALLSVVFRFLWRFYRSLSATILVKHFVFVQVAVAAWFLLSDR